jgi:hypothetical protein
MNRNTPVHNNSELNKATKSPTSDTGHHASRERFRPDPDDPIDWAAEEQFMWAITAPSTVGLRGARRDRS